MIITEQKPYGMIRTQLTKEDKISIVSCNTCVRICETGGEKAMNELADKLSKDGFTVLNKDLIGAACDFDQIKDKKVGGNAIIVLACDAGIYNLKKLFPEKKIIPALDTIGLGVWDEKGDITLIKSFSDKNER